jgi:hypothetical protein
MKDWHRPIAHDIENDFEILRKHLYLESQVVVIAFRQPDNRSAAPKGENNS